MKDWRDLESRLFFDGGAKGAFSARTEGFLGSKFALYTEGDDEFGVLTLEDSAWRSPGVASFRAGELTAAIESSGLTRRMWTAGEETLGAKSGYSGIEIRHAGEEFEASVSPFRNSASCYGGGLELVRVAGGLMSRNYTVVFERGRFEVAVFLLHYTASARKRAFRADAAMARK